MMRVFPFPQSSPEWLLEHSKLVTASRVKDVMAKGEGKSRKKLMAELAASILTDTPRTNGFTSDALTWGLDHEQEAKDRYAEITGWEVEPISLTYHPTIEGAGASPDGLVGFDGLAEIKCPETHTFISYVIDDVVPSDYHNQLNWQLACTGKSWTDFVAFDPRLPYAHNIFIKRFYPDRERIAAMEAEVRKFLAELNELISRFR